MLPASLKNRIFLKYQKIMEKEETPALAIGFICRVDLKVYFTV
jgi:hypothetical protein